MLCSFSLHRTKKDNNGQSEHCIDLSGHITIHIIRCSVFRTDLIVVIQYAGFENLADQQSTLLFPLKNKNYPLTAGVLYLPHAGLLIFNI